MHTWWCSRYCAERSLVASDQRLLLHSNTVHCMLPSTRLAFHALCQSAGVMCCPYHFETDGLRAGLGHGSISIMPRTASGTICPMPLSSMCSLSSHVVATGWFFLLKLCCHCTQRQQLTVEVEVQTVLPAVAGAAVYSCAMVSAYFLDVQSDCAMVSAYLLDARHVHPSNGTVPPGRPATSLWGATLLWRFVLPDKHACLVHAHTTC